MEKGFTHRQQYEELEATELRLGLPGTERPHTPSSSCAAKRSFVPDAADHRTNSSKPTKSQVVGWPPVRSFRRNIFDSNKAEPAPPATTHPPSSPAAHFIKVSMDGAPFLRKVDLNALNGYKDLRLSLDAMFRCTDDFSVTYEDKDGDWMLVGDVPWDMFTHSCRRLRIINPSQPTGITATR